MRTTRFGVAMVILLAVSAAAGASPSERWYLITLDGARAGHAVQRDHTDADGHLTHENRFAFTLTRLGQTLELALTTFVTEHEGEYVSMRFVESSGPAGREQTHDAPPEHADTTLELLTPSEVDVFVADHLERGRDSWSYAIYNASSGWTPVEVTTRVLGETIATIGGAERAALRTESTLSVMPGVTTEELIDPATGESLRSTLALGAMEFVVELTDEAVATSDFEPAELMAGTLITPRTPIDQPRWAERLELIVSTTGGPLPDLLNEGVQRFERLDESRARLTIDLDRRQPAGDDAREAFLGRSSLVDPEDPVIQQLAESTRADLDPLAWPVAMTHFVADHIDDKSLSYGFASASDAARARAGDCTEHAALLVAMLRASDIPARLVSGLVDAGGVWGFHMWAQAAVDDGDGRLVWRDLDPAIPAPPRWFDAAHIAINVLEQDGDGGVNELVRMVELIGRLEIEPAP
ncbi:MAG: transglutaminase domain-containing protein [Planctomycetota bacterium]